MNKNDWKYQVITILFIFLGCNSAMSQIEYAGKPMGFAFDKNQDVIFITINPKSSGQENKIKETNQSEGEFKIDFFAQTVNVGINPSIEGKWDQVNAITSIWRLGIASPDAESIGLTFDPFFLLPGAKVCIYTPDGAHKAGAFTFRNNKSIGLLTVSSLPGDSIIIELQTQTDPTEFGELSISTLSIGFRKDQSEKTSDDEWFGRSAECHVDINCINDPFVQQQKYAACRLIIERIDGRVRCSGTLLNNVSENGLPYVLTAGHCITDMYAANHTVVYFDYESPYCDGPDGEIGSVSGSLLRSRSGDLDFALIELTDKPPVDYYPVYSGWDARGNTFDYSYTIHHPQGDVKKFANDSDLVQEGTFANFDPGTHWLIADYEIGTTEQGSSGCPLFDKNNRFVGSLSGGGSVCSELIYDYYQKFSDAWNSYPGEDNQLKAWLDPDNTGIRIINNLEPFQGITEIITNIQTDDIIEAAPIVNGWGYISGHNSLHSTIFIEHFYRNGSKYIYALKMNVAKAFASNINSGIKVSVWEGGNIPKQMIFEKNLYLFEFSPELETYIRLDTLILVDKDFFVGYTINYTEPSDTFALYTVIHDNDDENSALMWRGNGWEYLNNGTNSYSASLAISPLVLDYYPKADAEYGEYPFAEVTLYPNPTYDIIQILFENKPEGDVIISIYDLIGNILYKKQVFQPEPNIQFQTHEILNQGIFIMKIEYDNKTAMKKFIKLQ